MDTRDVIFGQLTNRCRIPEFESSYSTVAKGNGLFLKSDADPKRIGTILFEEFPIGTTAVAFFDHTLNYCANCISPLTVPVPCLYRCGEMYCSANCLNHAALYHKILCAARSPNFKLYHSKALETSNEYFIIAARLLVLFPSAPWLFHFHCPGWTELENSSGSSELEIQTTVMLELLRGTFNDGALGDGGLINYDRLSRTVGMLRVNVLGLLCENLNVGFAMYSTQSLLNHSPDPNCRCVSITSSLCGIEAVKKIDPGDELFIDYVADMRKLSAKRSRTLGLQYGIEEARPHTDNRK
jgi:hypothetical protein